MKPVPDADTKPYWDGIAAGDGVQYRARLSPNTSGKYLFELERQGPSGLFRGSLPDRCKGDRLEEVLPHSAGVLQRVATEGR